MVAMAKADKITLETQDNYQKQTYRNRAYIAHSNGKLLLNIPIRHSKNIRHQKTKDVAPENNFPWLTEHWKSIQIAYRTSPYFEFYEDDFYPFYHQKFEKLMDFNIALIKKVLSLIHAEVKLLPKEKTADEFNDMIIAKYEVKKENPHYQQVFQSKHGFINNLSILDLLFNLGPQSLEYLGQVDH